MTRRRRGRVLVLDTSHLSPEEKHRSIVEGIPFPPPPDRVPDVYRGPNYYDNLSRVPSFVDVDSRHIYKEGQTASQRRYTRTGAFLTGTLSSPTRSAPDRTEILHDLPDVLDIKKVDDLRAYHTVFVDRNTGVIHAVLDAHNKKDVAFYRRYYSLTTMYIVEMSGSEVKKKDRTKHYALIINGVCEAWETEDNLDKRIAESDSLVRHILSNKITVETRGFTFAGVENNLPKSIDPHTVLQYNFRYAGWKEG